MPHNKTSTLTVNTPNKQPNRQMSSKPFQSLVSPKVNSRQNSNTDLLNMVKQMPKSSRQSNLNLPSIINEAEAAGAGFFLTDIMDTKS